MAGMRSLPGRGTSVRSQDNASPPTAPTGETTGRTRPRSLCSRTCPATVALAFTATLEGTWTAVSATSWEQRSHLATQIPASNLTHVAQIDSAE
jgi:hypothetical protein